MKVGVLRETYPGENRVALVPAVLASLKKGGIDVVLEAGAGMASGYPDAEYANKGAQVVASRSQVFQESDCIVQVRMLGANPHEGKADLQLFRNDCKSSRRKGRSPIVSKRADGHGYS